jgi:hypothetical protein
MMLGMTGDQWTEVIEFAIFAILALGVTWLMTRGD